MLAEIDLDTEFKIQDMTMLLFLIHEGRHLAEEEFHQQIRACF